MKKATKLVCVLALVLAVLLSGCERFHFSFTTVLNNTKIEVNDAVDGDFAESSPISVGKDRVVVVDSALEKGKLKIDFTEATVFSNEDGPDDVILGDVVASVTVGRSGKERIALERGDYVMQIEAIGETDGVVTVNVEKR